jgi:hypothetical protein
MRAKAVAKKDVNELFKQLAHKYATLLKTFQALSDNGSLQNIEAQQT